MYFNNKNLLTPSPNQPAYNNRTAWLMANLSHLAYFPFEGSDTLIADDAQQVMNDYLGTGGFRLLQVFQTDLAQAFLATSDHHRMNVLAFRGTGKNLNDIRSDLKATMVCVDDMQIHRGFYEAFQSLESQLENVLEAMSHNGYPLYVTGHSLGGALALITTRFLANRCGGACYTFGSPRVACSRFGDAIETPVYRVVNAADIVPRLPAAYLQTIPRRVLRFVRMPYLSKKLADKLSRFPDYRHHGDLRYLTTCGPDYENLRLLSNPSIIERLMRFLRRLHNAGYQVAASDHGIVSYQNKLAVYAERH